MRLTEGVKETLTNNRTPEIPMNTNDVKEFFRFLSHGNLEQIQTYCFLDFNSVEVIKGHGVKFGKLEDITKECEEFREKFTLHTCLNLSNLKGRRLGDIVTPRVLCVDLDREVKLEEINLWMHQHDIGMVVQSSIGKYHLYWKYDGTLEQWKRYQLALAWQFKGDFGLEQVNKTIRVPGVLRGTKGGAEFMPQIKYLNHITIPVTDSTIIEKFPWLNEAHAKGEEYKKTAYRETRDKIKKARIEQRQGFTGGALIDAPAIGRNNALYSTVKEEIGSGELTLEEAQALGTEINGHFTEPLGEEEVKKTVNSAHRAALEKMEARQEVIEEKKKEIRVRLGDIGFDYDYGTEFLCINRFTDLASLERVIQRFGSSMFRNCGVLWAFDGDTKTWIIQKSSSELLQSFLKQVCQDVINDEKFIETCCTTAKGEFSESLKVREETKWLSASKHSGLLQLLKNSADIVRKEFSECDTNKALLNCKNGVLNLVTKEFRQAKPDDYLLKQTPVIYNPQAECPWWKNFVSEVFAENITPTEIITFIQEVFGYTLTGSIREQCIFVHCGDGANGKSRMLYALQMLLGGYSGILEPKALSQIGTSQFTKEFNRLGVTFEGRRCVVIDDLNTKTQWDESLVKILTSETLKARYLYGEERDIPNNAKIHIGCNSIPETDAGGYAVFRRICIINYPRTFEVNSIKNREIEFKIKEELSGILNWAIEGLDQILNQNGGKLKRPDEVTIANENYASGSFDVTDLFPKIFHKVEDKEEPNWVPLSDMTETLNSYLIGVGKRDKQVSVDSMGRFCARKYSSKRTYGENKTKKITFYNVKIKGSFL